METRANDHSEQRCSQDLITDTGWRWYVRMMLPNADGLLRPKFLAPGIDGRLSWGVDAGEGWFMWSDAADAMRRGA